MLARMIVGGRAVIGSGARPPPLSPPDFIVTSDAEWDTVFANSAAALVGKTVEVSGSSFTQRTIANKDIDAAGGRLTIRSANGTSSLPSLSITGIVRGIDFAGLHFQTTGWPKTYLSCFHWAGGTFSKIRFLGCTFRHGYSPALVDYDTTAELPEYERIDNVQTAAAASATYPLTWKDPAFSVTTAIVEFFNRGANPVRAAVGGAGVVADGTSQLVAAGANFRFVSLNPTTATHFAVLATAGTSEVNARAEIGLSAYASAGFSASGTAVLEDVEIRNCTFRDLADAVKFIPKYDNLLMMDNLFERIYSDQISLPVKPGAITRDLRTTHCLSFARSGIAENLTGDAGDPHGGDFQTFGEDISAIGPIFRAGQRTFVTPQRVGSLSGGIFLSDNEVSPSYSDIFLINCMPIGGTGTATVLSGQLSFPARNAMIYGYTGVSFTSPSSTDPQVRLTAADDSVYIGSMVAVNINDQVAPTLREGVIDLLDVASPAAVFPNHGNLASATTRSAVEAALTTAAEGAGLGMSATVDTVNWTTSDPDAVIRWENVPSGVHWAALTGQALNTVITLPLRKILNPRPAQTVSVGAGTEWRKVAADGTTELLAWGTAPGTIEPGQHIQIRHTSSADGGATVTAAVSINGFNQAVPILTAAAPNAFLVQGSPISRFQDPATPPVGTTRMTWRGKFFWPAGTIASSQKPFAQNNLGCDLMTTGNGFRPLVADSTGAAMFSGTAVRHVGSYVADDWLDIVFDVDQTARTATLTINGVTEVYPFANPGNGLFQTSRVVGFAAPPLTNSGASVLPAGVRCADMSVEFNGVLRKAIPNNAASANADPWKAGTGVFTSVP